MTLTLLSTILAGPASASAAPRSSSHPPGSRRTASRSGSSRRAGRCPCWADIDGDGKKDLLVGQFNGGKIRVYKNLGDGKLAAGEWLKADGAVAEIPGVW